MRVLKRKSQDCSLLNPSKLKFFFYSALNNFSAMNLLCLYKIRMMGDENHHSDKLVILVTTFIYFLNMVVVIWWENCLPAFKFDTVIIFCYYKFFKNTFTAAYYTVIIY